MKGIGRFWLAEASLANRELVHVPVLPSNRNLQRVVQVRQGQIREAQERRQIGDLCRVKEP